MIGTANRVARWAYHRLREGHRRRWAEAQRRRIDAILHDPAPPQHCDDQALFERLQQQFPPRPEYGYDAYSCWRRGAFGAMKLIEVSGLQTPGAKVLEACCGDGMTGAALANYGHEVMLLDLEDWRDARARRLPFLAADLCKPVPLPDDRFDLVFSFNAMEHVPDPAAALRQLVRLCRPGGMIHLDFGPLFASPWGLHAYRTLRMPWPQFLFSEAFLRAKFKELGLWDLGRARDDLQPLNRWRLKQFRAAFAQTGCELIDESHRLEPDWLDVIEKHPQAFRGRGLTFEDVTVHQLTATLRKPAAKHTTLSSAAPALAAAG